MCHLLLGIAGDICGSMPVCGDCLSLPWKCMADIVDCLSLGIC